MSRVIGLLTLELDRDVCSTPHPSSLLPGKTRNPLYRRLGGPQGRSGWVQKMLSPLGFDPWIIQPVVSRYTDYATPAHNKIMHTCQSTCRINNNQNVVIIINVCTIIFLIMVSVNKVGDWDTDPLREVHGFRNGVAKDSNLVGYYNVPSGE